MAPVKAVGNKLVASQGVGGQHDNVFVEIARQLPHACGLAVGHAAHKTQQDSLAAVRRLRCTAIPVNLR